MSEEVISDFVQSNPTCCIWCVISYAYDGAMLLCLLPVPMHGRIAEFGFLKYVTMFDNDSQSFLNMPVLKSIIVQ